jgi:hypothetical protein
MELTARALSNSHTSANSTDSSNTSGSLLGRVLPFSRLGLLRLGLLFIFLVALQTLEHTAGSRSALLVFLVILLDLRVLTLGSIGFVGLSALLWLRLAALGGGGGSSSASGDWLVCIAC